jgi:aryl carrier-like protein
MSIARNTDGSAPIDNKSQRGGDLERILSSVETNPLLLDEPNTLDELTDLIGKHVYTLMLQSAEEIDKQQTLEGLGIDSLVTIEIRTWWKRSLGFEVSTLEILNASTIKGLGELAINGMRNRVKRVAAEAT